MRFAFQEENMRIFSYFLGGISKPSQISVFSRLLPLQCRTLSQNQSSSSQIESKQLTDAIPSSKQTNDEVDALYSRVVVEARGHDRAVLKSYEWFAVEAAKQLEIPIHKTWIPRAHFLRKDTLKSVHIYKKHMVQYEFRTYFRVIELKYLTGSTADTYLEYIQRNLPEGVAMKVTKTALEELPPHIKPPSKRSSASS